ncbi:MAG: hypothetical protein HQK76_09990 [Desulfobacterales bacterium]|nr:hypothetical protein [Desulfobacterales bacterium]
MNSPLNQMDSLKMTKGSDEVGLFDLILPVYKYWKFLIAFTFCVVVLTGIVGVTSTKIYRATSVLLPEIKENAGGGELKAAFLTQFGFAGLGGEGTSSAVYESILKSRELARNVLKRYNYFYLMGIDKKNEEIAIDNLLNSIVVQKPAKEPTISIIVDVSDRYMCKDIANAYIYELDNYNREVSITSAQRLRKYIEKRLENAEKEQEAAQAEFQAFQENNRAISISKQTNSTLDVLAGLESQRVEIEIEKAAKEQFYGGAHIEIEQLNAKMEALQKNIDRLVYSNEKSVPIKNEKGLEFYIPLTKIPYLNFEESKLLAKNKAKAAVVSMLYTQSEQAKLDEAKDMPTINILDWAVPPIRHIKPKLKAMLVLGALGGLFLGAILVFLFDFIKSSKFKDFKNRVKTDGNAV